MEQFVVDNPLVALTILDRPAVRLVGFSMLPYRLFDEVSGNTASVFASGIRQAGHLSG